MTEGTMDYYKTSTKSEPTPAERAKISPMPAPIKVKTSLDNKSTVRHNPKLEELIASIAK